MAALVRALTLNWKLKLLAFILAVLLWVVVSAEQVTTQVMQVPLEVEVTDAGYELRESSVPDQVEVRFTGPGRDLLALAIGRPTLRLSIPEVEDTASVFALDPRMVHVPTELAVDPNDVRPGSVRLEFTRMDTRTVPVRVDVGQELASGWTLVDSLRVEPSEVRITGPAARLGNVTSISTHSVNLSTTDSTFTRTVALDTAGLGGLDLSATRVQVSGQVDRVLERVLRGVPISLGEGVGVRPNEVDVRLRGARSLVRPVSPRDLRVVVSIDSIPDTIPATGVVVPLSVEGEPRGVYAEPQPRTVRLLPAQMVLDTVTVPAEAADTTGAGERGG